MANATAPLKKKVSEDQFLPDFQFDAKKKYMFRLAVESAVREQPVVDMVTKRNIPHQKYKPFHNIVFTSQIVWEGSRRMIRYYDGCTSLFVDEQPKERETIEMLIKQSKPRAFLDGMFGIFGDERMLLIYMNICSWNGESDYRTRTADTIFIPLDKIKSATLEEQRLDAIDTARDLAKGATPEKMKIHASYLGIPSIDFDSGNELTEKEIRTLYRQEAIQRPNEFIESYGNKKIEAKYFIDKALLDGIINNKLNANKASWKSGAEICDISGLKSNEAIAGKLFEFSQTEEGEELIVQLKAIYN